MLASMRNTVSGIFAKTLMMFLVITFAVWGIGDVVRSGASSNTVALVGDSEITGQEFGHKLQEIQRQSEGAIPPEVLNSPMMRNQILQRVIEERLITLATKDLGIAVGTELVAKSTKENLAFQNVDGSFNAQNFAAYLRDTGQSETLYSQRVAKEVSRRLLTDAVQLDQFTLPEAYMALTSLSLAERRSANILTISASDIGAIDDNAVKDFYEQHKNDFYLQPETRTLTIAAISQASIEAATKGKDSATAFETLTYAIDDAIAAGQTMSDALKTSKLSAQMNTLTVTKDAGKNDLEEAAIQQAFALNEGESSGLISAKDGSYFMVHVDSVTPESPKPFEVVKDDVTKRYRTEKGAELAKEKASELKRALTSEEGIDAKLKLAVSKGANLRDSGLLQRPEIAAAQTIPPALHNGIFGASKGDIVGPVLLKNGDYALAIVSTIDVPKTALTPNSETQTALKDGISAQVYNAMLMDLVKRHPVKQVADVSAPAQE